MAAAGDCNGSTAIFTEVVLVRHGETLWNASRILQGHIDSELNDIGRQQAVAVASHLSKEKDFVAIYSSDLQRAAETAQIIASSCNLPEVILDPSLRERHLGDLQGLTIKDAKKQKPIAFKHLLSAKRDQELPGGGESLVQLHERCASFLEKLAKKHEGERIIVVTHGGVLRELYRRACPKGPLKGNIKNASVNVIHMHENGLKWTVKKWGYVGHLRELGVIEDAFGGDRTSGNIEHVYFDTTPTLKAKKRKNFLWSSNPEWIAALLQIMCEYVDANMRSAQGFKDTVYKGATQKIKERFGVEVTTEQCKNQICHQRTVWTHIQELKKKSGVSWDENKKIIIMGHEEYVSHIQAFPKDATFLNVPITNYMELKKVCGEGHATGEWSKSANSQFSFGFQAINLNDEDLNSLPEFNTYASQPIEQIEVNTTKESTGGTKRSMPSSSKGYAPRKKSKTNSMYQSLQECISLMADSIAKVASAIESTSKAAEERKIYTELLAELSNISGFSEEEIDLIYDNLSKRPTMIQSFLPKSKESKARWMHKELGR